MSKENNKVREEFRFTVKEAEKLKSILGEIEESRLNGRYDEAIKKYNNFLKENVEIAEVLKRIEKERIDYTKESLGILKSLGNLEFGDAIYASFDKIERGIVKGGSLFFEFLGKSKEEAEAMGKIIPRTMKGISEMALSFSEESPFDHLREFSEKGVEGVGKKIQASFFRGFNSGVREEADEIIADVRRVGGQMEEIAQKRLGIESQTIASIQDIRYDANEIAVASEGEFQKQLRELAETEAQKREEIFRQEKIALKEQLAEKLITKEDYAKAEEELTIQYLEKEVKIRRELGLPSIDLEEQLADMRVANAKNEGSKTIAIESQTQTTRIQQWQAYAEKVSEISQQVSEITGMVANSLGGMFGQMAESYQQEVESLNEKIAAVDEEKELALADIALTEDERQIREEELAQQKIMLENATSEEQKLKAQERIATLQNELTSEDVISKEYDKKKEELEKEKQKKEKQAKDAEKMKKRVEMGQAIVEAIGNVAAGAAKALSFGPFLGPVLAAIVAAAGAVQIGIMTKQLAQMEDGGLLRGKRHRNGGMPILGSNIEVEGGEYVVNRESTGKNLGLISYINSQRRSLSPADISDFFGSQGRVHEPSFGRMFREGGQLPVMERMPNLDNELMMDAIRNIKFEPKVSVTDINTAQDDMARVDSWVGM